LRSPLVSFIIPAYNAENYLDDCLNSIINQSYENWEAILIDDGSTDGTYKKLLSYNDKRFRIFKNEKNLGLADVRNLGVSLSNAEWIAWLDSDDIASLDRLQIQMEFIKENPYINMCGSWIQLFGAKNDILKYKSSDIEIRNLFLFEDPLATSSLTMKRDLFAKTNIKFSSEFAPAEDYDVWERLLPFSKMANIQKVLCYYRIHENNTSQLLKKNQIEAVKNIQTRHLLQFGIDIKEIDYESHLNLGIFYGKILKKEALKNVITWIRKLYKHKISRELEFIIFKKGYYLIILNHHLNKIEKITYIIILINKIKLYHIKYLIYTPLYFIIKLFKK
jgi:glycosyltransferase involved in cell wall biosynthesis